MLADRDVVRFFREQEITRDLPGEALDLFLRAVERRDFHANEVLLREEEVSHSLFFVSRGEVEVLKRDDDSESLIPIGELAPGAPFGEMSFMDEQPASATIRARTPGSLWVLSRNRLADLGADVAPVQHHLSRSIARTVIRRLRDTNESYVESVASELEESRLRVQFGQFFLMTIVLFGIATMIPRFISTSLPPLLQMGYSWGFLLLLLAPILLFIRQQKAAPADFGLTLENWKPDLKQGSIIAAGIIVVGSLVRWQVNGGGQFVTWGSLSSYSPVEFNVFMALYLPHCFLQEFVSRGVIQGSLSRFMDQSHPLLPAVITSFLFGVFHLYVSVSFAFITFAVSLFLGIVYTRRRSLAGVTLIHYMLGIVSLAYGFN